MKRTQEQRLSHRELKAKMVLCGLTQKDIAAETGKSTAFISNRMQDGEWPLQLCYKILDMIGEPAEMMALYFKKGA